MKRGDTEYEALTAILKEELVVATGCTEPISVAYAAARARDVLGRRPERVEVAASGSVLKNAQSAVVPHTGGLRGIEAAAAAGIAAGRSEAGLDLLGAAGEREGRDIREYLAGTEIRVRALAAEESAVFEIRVRAEGGGEWAEVRLVDTHTHVARVEKNGQTLYEDAAERPDGAGGLRTDRSVLSVEKIWEYAEALDPEDVRGVLERQARCNWAIAEEGLRGDWGANVGSVLLATEGEGVRTRAKAMAAAGSDARMSGCEMPVVINSGSGNQGITASVPVLVWAKERGAGEAETLKALALANLVAIHQKDGMGRLSAYCGAVTAAAGAGAGIAYLCGGGCEGVAHTIVNALAVASGIVCDGAKPSCAGKIAAAVEAAQLGWGMYERGQEFKDGEGLVRKGVEATLRNVARLGNEGMRETNAEIIRMMTGC